MRVRNIERFCEWLEERTKRLNETSWAATRGSWEVDEWEINGVMYSFKIKVTDNSRIEIKNMQRWDEDGNPTPVVLGTPEFEKVKDDYETRDDENIQQRIHDYKRYDYDRALRTWQRAGYSGELKWNGEEYVPIYRLDIPGKFRRPQ